MHVILYSSYKPICHKSTFYSAQKYHFHGGERPPPPVVHGVYKTTVVHEGLRVFCQIQKILIRTKDRIKRILRDKNLTCEIHYAKKSLLLLITLTLIKGALRSKYIENKPSMFFLHTVENR